MNKCNYCHSTENLTIDHKIPVSKGGKDTVENTQCLCQTCNSMKGSLTHKEVRKLFKWFIEIQKARNKEDK